MQAHLHWVIDKKASDSDERPDSIVACTDLADSKEVSSVQISFSQPVNPRFLPEITFLNLAQEGPFLVENSFLLKGLRGGGLEGLYLHML